jgi:hypothetical protein
MFARYFTTAIATDYLCRSSILSDPVLTSVRLWFARYCRTSNVTVYLKVFYRVETRRNTD